MGALTKIGETPPHDPTLRYSAPEYLLEMDTTSGDIWSLGCVFYELATSGKPLFCAFTDKKLLSLIFTAIGLPEKRYVEKSRLFNIYFREVKGKLGLCYLSLDKPSSIYNAYNDLIKKNATPREAADFINLITQMVRWKNRPDPTTLLAHPFFQTASSSSSSSSSQVK